MKISRLQVETLKPWHGTGLSCLLIHHHTIWMPDQLASTALPIATPIASNPLGANSQSLNKKELQSIPSLVLQKCVFLGVLGAYISQ